MNWNTNWIFPLEDELDFSKGTLFFPSEDKLIRQTEFFLLEGELDFSKGIPLNFFPLEDKQNFSLGRQTEFFKGYTFEFFPLEDKLNFSKGTYYLRIFSLGKQTEFFKGYLLPLNFFPWKTNWIFQRVLTTFEYFLFLRSKSNLLTQTHKMSQFSQKKKKKNTQKNTCAGGTS